MQTKMPNIFKKLADILRHVPFLNTILKPIYHKLGRHYSNNRFMALHTNGIRVLQEFDKALAGANIPYSVYAGTLLGAIRENGILKHDFDIDTAVFAEQDYNKVRRALENSGFTLLRYFEVDNSKSGREETYCKDGVDIDIFYIYRDENGITYNCDFHPIQGTRDLYDSMRKHGRVGVRKCELPVSQCVVRAPFEDIYVNVLVNADEWLKARYGVNYMVPDPNFKDTGREKNIYEWTSVMATFNTL